MKFFNKRDEFGGIEISTIDLVVYWGEGVVGSEFSMSFDQ